MKVETSFHMEVSCLDLRDFSGGSTEENKNGRYWLTIVLLRNSHKSYTSNSFRIMRLCLVLLEPA